jgi:hypothetical protein
MPATIPVFMFPASAEAGSDVSAAQLIAINQHPRINQRNVLTIICSFLMQSARPVLRVTRAGLPADGVTGAP